MACVRYNYPTQTEAQLLEKLRELDEMALTPFIVNAGTGETSWQRNNLSKGEIERIKNLIKEDLSKHNPTTYPPCQALPNQTRSNWGGSL